MARLKRRKTLGDCPDDLAVGDEILVYQVPAVFDSGGGDPLRATVMMGQPKWYNHAGREVPAIVAEHFRSRNGTTFSDSRLWVTDWARYEIEVPTDVLAFLREGLDAASS